MRTGRLVLMLAWRQSRGAGRSMLAALVCIVIGVAALVAVGSFSASLERAVGASAKALLGGDVEVRGAYPLSPASEAVLGAAAPGAAVARARELLAMAHAGGDGGLRTRLVEVKAVDRHYPLYGRLAVDPAEPLPDLLGGGRALVHPSLLEALDLRVGARLRLGRAEFLVSGVILEEPDRAVGLFALGPRVLIAQADLDATGLVQPGSRIRHRALLRLPAGADVERVTAALAAQLPDRAVRVTSYAHAQPGIQRFWDQLTTYLGLAGLVALLVAGIGVAASIRAFLARSRDAIAILKCLGATSGRLAAAYGLQAAGLGLAGSAAGALVGVILQPLLVPALAPLLPLPVDAVPSPMAALRGIAMGLGTTVLFALWPLLAVRDVPPALLLRHQVEPTRRARRPWLAALPLAGGLAALALWQAGSWMLGGLFLGGLVAAVVLLAGAARLLAAVGRRLGRPRGALAWRQAVANLHRPGSQAGTVLVSLGLAVTLVVAVALLEASLQAELGVGGRDRAPAFFFIDIQPDQVEPFRELVTEQSGGAPDVMPVVRARLTAVDATPIPSDVDRTREDAWYLAREYVLTWAEAPPPDNRIVAGRWWTPAEAAREPLISLEDHVAEHLGVGVGSTLTLDIQGVPLTARVASLRRVNWRTLGANFFMIFSPGALDGAPATAIATARVRPEDERRLEAAVVAAFPNVTAIPVREVLERVGAVVDQISLAVRLVAAASILAGLVVMAGALGVTRRERLYQSVVWKVFGATRGALARSFALEYALLGAAAGCGGTVLGATLALAVLHWVFQLPWTWAPAPLALGVAAPTALALLVGFLGTFRLLGARPLPVLRAE